MVNIGNNFYVYEWYNTDTNEVFYIGKGKDSRYKDTKSRNQYFKNYYNKYKCNVRKIKTDLTEDEAFELEKELILNYKNTGQCMCNITNGGEGTSFPPFSRNALLRKLRMSQYCFKDYDELEKMSIRKLILEDHERMLNKEDERLFKILDIYDEQENLNLGWECFEY